MSVSALQPLVLANGVFLDPATGREEGGDLIADAGLIRDFGHAVRGSRPDGAKVVDCKGMTVAPGLIETAMTEAMPSSSSEVPASA